MLKKKNMGQIVLNVVFICICLCYLVPFLVMISVSFSDEAAIVREGYSLIPKVFSLEAYKLVFRNPEQILNSYAVTIFISFVGTGLSVLIMALMAYPMSRSNYKFCKPLAFYCLITMLFSGGTVSSYLLNVKYLGLKNNILVYILPGLVSAYYLLLIRTNYKSLPSELMEAAELDGAGELRICFGIVMPLCKPVLASVAFLTFVDRWNSWMSSQLYMTNPKLYTLQYLLQKLLTETEFLRQMAEQGQMVGMRTPPSETLRFAMAVVAAGPVLVIFPFFQKYFSKGLMLGGIKG